MKETQQDDIYNPRDYDPTRPSAISLALTSMVAAYGTLSPDKQASEDAPKYSLEASDGFLRDAEELANMWEARGAALRYPKTAKTWDDKRAALDEVFSQVFLAWFKQHNHETPTTPEDCETFLNNLDAELARWKPSTEEETTAQLVEKNNVGIKSFIYNNTRLRHILDDSSEWLDAVFRHPVDLTDKQRKKKNGAQDLLYVTIKPEARDTRVRYEFEKDPQFCQLVLDSVSSLYDEGQNNITDLDATRKLTGRDDVKTIAPELRKRVTETIDILRNTHATIEAPSVIVKGKKAQPVEVDGFLLDFIRVKIPQGGHVVEGYHLQGEPLLSALSKTLGKTGERIAIPTKYLEIHEIAEGGGTDHPLYPETVQRIKLRTYLLTYILRRRGNKTGVQQYGAKVEKKASRKKRPLDAAEAARRIKTKKTKAANLCHIRIETLYTLAGAQTVNEKRRVERDAVTMLRWWVFRWPQLLKGFNVRTTVVKGERGRPKNVKTIDLEL